MSNDYTPGLDPRTQAIIQFLLQGSGAAEAQQQWQGAADPAGLGQLSFGFDPSQMQQQSLAGFIPPSQDPEDAGSLEEAGRQGNYLQDFSDLTADPVIAALMGGGSFAGDSFAPTVQRELIARPATQQFNQWLTNAQGGELSFEGLVAQAVQRGRSPRTAVSEMRQLLQQADADAKSDSPDSDLQAQAEAIRSFLPPSFQYDAGGTPLTGDASINWQSAFDDADDLVKPYQDEQQTQPGPVGATYDEQGNMTSSGGNIVVGEDGQFYRETTEESPLAEKYRELGIPLPTETYEAGDLLGAGWQQANQAYLDNLPQTDDAYRQLMSDLDAARSNATGANLSQSDVFRLDSMDNATGRVPTAAPGGAPAPAAGGGDAGQRWDELWNNGPPDSAAQRLQGVGEVVGPPAEAAGQWFQDLFSGAAAGPQTVTTGTDAYGMPTTSSTGGGFESVPADVGQAGLTDLNVLAGPNSVTARGLDNWWGGLAGGAQSAANTDWLGAISDATGNWWQDWTGASDRPSGQAAGGQQYSPGGAEDPFAGMTLAEQQAAVAANPALQSSQWQQLLAQSQQTPGTPLPPLNTDDLAAIFARPQGGGGGGQIAAAPGIGGGGAGGQGAPRTLADLMPAAGAGDLPRPPRPGTTRPPVDANTLAMLRQMLTPTQVFENQRQAQFNQPTSNASTRTGPEPSEGVQTSNASSRTGPEPSEGATAPRGLELLWPGGQQRQTPSQGSTNEMLRMLFGMDPATDTKSVAQSRSGGRPNGKLSMSGHRASPVDTYKLTEGGRARRLDREGAWSRYRQNQDYNALYGRDYWQARGYAEALQSLGVTPTSVALANRTGGVNALMGR